MQKFNVSYSLPYHHRVVVTVLATSAEHARSQVEKAFDAGTLWDDTAERTLIYDDYEEDGTSGEVLEFEVEQSTEDLKPDASVTSWRARETAFAACRALVAAYDESEATGGSVPWEGVGEAFRLALKAVRPNEAEAEASAEADATEATD